MSFMGRGVTRCAAICLRHLLLEMRCQFPAEVSILRLTSLYQLLGWFSRSRLLFTVRSGLPIGCSRVKWASLVFTGSSRCGRTATPTFARPESESQPPSHKHRLRARRSSSTAGTCREESGRPLSACCWIAASAVSSDSRCDLISVNVINML